MAPNVCADAERQSTAAAPMRTAPAAQAADKALMAPPTAGFGQFRRRWSAARDQSTCDLGRGGCDRVYLGTARRGLLPVGIGPVEELHRVEDRHLGARG